MKESAIAVGSLISHYQVTGKLGAGGMGEVYRARDTKLNRDVAIKILPEGFARDAERVARFQREAQVLASLNHPNIASIYGLEDSNGTHALVLELVEGPTLADRITAGPIPINEALPIARQIAEALEYAHERGIIHRDMKPANVKVTGDGTTKVLDFGLAKVFADDTPDTDLSHSPTLIKGTQAGMILGTAAYMSPEQAQGKAVDKRSDIWSFGVVLYEVLTGRQLFAGETISDTLAAVLRDEIDLNALPANTPASIRKLIARCVNRDRKQRLRDIGDARLDLDERQDASRVAPQAASRMKTARWIGPVVASALITALVTWLAVRAPRPSPEPVRRFAVSGLSPLVIDPFQTLALSPDGRLLAFRGRGQDELERIFVRQLDTLELKVLADTNGARLPFFSADGQWIGFFAGGSLKKIAVAGGTAQTIATATTGPAGGTWMDDGSIVFIGDPELGIQRISSSGGTPETLLAFDKKNGERAAAAPWGLPGSRGVLLSVRRGDRFDVGVLSLRDRKLHIIAEDGYSPAWVPTGHVLFHQGNAILAMPFDGERLEATGPAFPVLSGLSNRMSFQTKLFAVAQDGTLAYLPQAPAGEGQWALFWVDRKGQETPVTKLERPSDTPRLSPDGTRVAFRTPADNCDVWSYDLARGTTTRLTQ
ncbi:MAG TPA: protein kinase, partial [Blastocatellia bacterium]|nr:protein kinase [Blastocatellia bacterium]